MRNTSINLEPDVINAVDAMAAKMKWSRSKTVNWILRQGVAESSNVLDGLKDLTLTDMLEMLAGRGVKKKLK
jgi:metal-responsive CopG/Arc/MetJ family transcriptional regulator